MLALLLAGGGLLCIGLSQAGAADRRAGAEGGTFRISYVTGGLTHVDPALGYTYESWAVLDATCARLMNYPDKPLPAGARLIPEVAVGYPRVSAGGKTYTFTLRKGFRFSDGTPIQASAFAHAIHRTIAPEMNSPGYAYSQFVVGAAAVRAGKRASASGVSASGNRLVIRLTRPVPDFPAQLTTPFFCAVPPGLPSDAEGVGAHAGSGPYFVSEYVRGVRVVLEENRFYRGARPHHVDRFDIDLQARTPQEVLARIKNAEADWGLVPPPFYFDPAEGLVRRYGVNRSQFFVKAGLELRGFAFNSSQPLFRDNAKLRRAVNFALDRPALLQPVGGKHAGQLTDQYQPTPMPGFVDRRIYPLTGPDLKRARALARGQTRSGKALLYTFDVAPALAAAQVLKQNLKQIGLDVTVKGLPPAAYFRRLLAPDARFDIAATAWVADYVDPYQFANPLFDGSFIGDTNLTHFNSPKYNALMRSAARLQGDARYRAYGRLDVQLARDAAPMAATFVQKNPTLVSKRVGCVVLRPSLDLTAVCLK